MSTPIVIDNPKLQRFELAVGHNVAIASYTLDQDNKIVSITQVVTPEALRGQGIAGKLMEGVVQIVRAREQKIIPICPYAVSWLKKHKEHQDLVL